MSSHDLIVIGGGPAGAEAAITGSALDLNVLLIDENDAAGGQVWRQPNAALVEAPSGHEAKAGALLRANLSRSRAQCRFGRRVWLAERGFVVRTLGPEGQDQVQAPFLIVASGAVERHLPVQGWTLPGVMGLAAATVLLKSAHVLPGERVVVAGAGPLLAWVANEILAGGGKVAAVIDANRTWAWIGNGRDLLSRPDLLARGAGWIARLRAAGVPWLSRRMVRSIGGTDSVAWVRIGPVDSGWAPVSGRETRLECDALCMGFGLMPASDILGLLGADFAWNPLLGGWAPVTNNDQATSIRGLYASGDGAGVLGAAAAPLSGKIAALAVARDLGRLEPREFERRAAVLRAQLRRASRFGRAMGMLNTPRMGAAAAISPHAEVCRCEGLTRATLDQAIAGGAVTVNDLKSATRCGMGPCGGRICGDVAELLIAAASGQERAAIRPATPRPPLRPAAIGTLAGAFDYASLPMAEPAPA